MGLVDSLCKLPAGDVNFQSALNQATKAQLQLAVKIMQLNTNGQNKTRIEACERKIKTLEDTSKETKPVSKGTTQKTAAKAESKPAKKEELKIVEFPSAKPKIKELPKSDEKHTYEECEKKLAPTRDKYNDADSIYVIEGLLSKCKEDQDFRNNLMRKEKTYDGFYQYMFNAVKAGYCVKVGNIGGMLTKEKALDLAYDYFNMSEVIKDEEKKEVAKKLTKEVNKIADEVKQKTEEIKPKKDNQIPGQLKFEF